MILNYFTNTENVCLYVWIIKCILGSWLHWQIFDHNNELQYNNVNFVRYFVCCEAICILHLLRDWLGDSWMLCTETCAIFAKLLRIIVDFLYQVTNHRESEPLGHMVVNFVTVVRANALPKSGVVEISVDRKVVCKKVKHAALV